MYSPKSLDQVEKVTISKHLVNSPVVVLSADYGWTAQMEKVMKSQAFADQSKFEFMKSKRMFEVSTHGLPRTCARTCTPHLFSACVSVHHTLCVDQPSAPDGY